jgi:hypothetical protein
MSASVVWAGESETEYYGLFLDGKKVGHAIAIRAVEAEKVTTSEIMNMTIIRGDVSMLVSTVETSIESTDGKPIGFESIQDISGMSQKVTGKINDDGKIEVTTTSMGMTQQETIDFPKGAVMAEGLRLLELEKGLAQGTEYTAVMFSPILLASVKVRISVGATENIDLLGRVLNLAKVDIFMQTLSGPINSTSYVDTEFRAMKTIVPMMGMKLELIACDKEFALSQNDVVDFFDKLLLKSPVVLKDVHSIESITYELVPKENAKLIIPSGDNQIVKQGLNGRIIVTVKPVDVPKGVKFPYKGKAPILLEALKPTRYLESDRKEIAALCRRALGGTKDAGKAIKQIESFVSGYITAKNLAVGYASAAEVAASREGDCSEHAVLAAAMCRSVGIPARVVCGLVYVDNFVGRKNIFGGHAWAEAYVGGKWVGIDATQAPNGFSPAHITLATGNGEPSDFFGMISTLGYFDIGKMTIVHKSLETAGQPNNKKP